MGRLTYATPEDVVGIVFGATTARAGTTAIASGIDTNEVLGTEDDRAYLTKRLDRAESQWDREATPMKPTRVGSADLPRFHSAKGKPWPVRLFLDHENIVPFDAATGDFLELRTGRDQYRDVTAQEGTAWTADYEQGIITIHRAPGRGQLPAFYRIRDKFAKVSYRVSGGGDFAHAGQTTLAESLNDSQTGAIDVADASRLPESGETVLLDGVEYAYVSSVDYGADTIELAERGVDLTPATSHTSAAEVHFCPSEVRDAVAKLAAVEVARGEKFTEGGFDDPDMDWSDDISGWQADADRVIANYSTQVGYT